VNIIETDRLLMRPFDLDDAIRVLSKVGFRSERRDTIMGLMSVYFDLESA
jgi:hypothetical protein